MSRSLSDGESGFGMTELLIATALTGVLSLLIMETMTGFSTVQQATIGSYGAVATADGSTTAIARVLRSAITTGYSSLVSASPSSITFNAIGLSGQYGTMQVWTSPATCPCNAYSQFTPSGGTAQPVTLLGQQLSNGNIFSFYSTPPRASELANYQIQVGSEGTTNSTTLNAIDLVQLTATVSDPSVGKTTVEQTIALPQPSQPGQ